MDPNAILAAMKAQGLYLDGNLPSSFAQITSDTRQLEKEISKNVLFFARKGATRDGHDYLKTIEKNPKIVGFVVEKLPEKFAASVPVLQVRDSTEAMAIASKEITGDPTASRMTIAVTGTNGKTTSTFLIESLLKVSGFRPARMGTIEIHFEGERESSDLTTPDFTQIQEKFGGLASKGATAFVFEASSHALDQRRLLGLELDVALFTNLTPEHLDYHRTMENYYVAKRKLFFELLSSSTKKKKIAVLPLDGAYGSRLAEELSTLPGIDIHTWGYGKDSPKLSPPPKF